MTINGIVERKLLLLEETLQELKSWEITDYTLFKNSSMQKKAVERSLTVCVEIMLDVTLRILAINKMPPKDSAIENLKQLEGLGVLKFSERYEAMIKFRNFIVHRYENIEPEILFDIISNRLNDYTAFIDEVRVYAK